MRIKITRTFIDRQASDPAKAEVEGGTELTVTVERGAELVAAGVAEEVGAPAAPRRGRPRRAKPADQAPAPAVAPAAPPAVDADPAPTA